MLMFVTSPSLRCYCSASQQAWHRLTHGHLSYVAIQWPGCSCSEDATLCLSPFHGFLLRLSPLLSRRTCLSIRPLSLFLPLYFSHIISYFLTSILSGFPLPLPYPHSAPFTSRSHTLVATFKAAVTMVTAMCCGNVKEPNPHRITSLF